MIFLFSRWKLDSNVLNETKMYFLAQISFDMMKQLVSPKDFFGWPLLCFEIETKEKNFVETQKSDLIDYYGNI